jgi:hypothetical protein
VGEVDHPPGKSDRSGRFFRVSQFAGRQFGLVTTGQLLELGLTIREIRSWVDRGLLHRIHLNVFAVGHPRLVTHGRLLAAQLT